MNWIKLTNKKGDLGESDLLFGERLPKDDPVFHVLGELDHLHATLADLSIALYQARPDDKDGYTRKWLDALGNRMIPIAGLVATKKKDVARYVSQFGDPVPEKEIMLQEVEMMYTQLGIALNERKVEAGWLHYHTFTQPLHSAIAKTVTRLRLVEGYLWRHLTPEQVGQVEEYGNMMKWFNRMSKIGHMVLVWETTNQDGS